MYQIGEVVTLNIDKHEGAGEGSLTVNAGITGMVVNSGRACREGDYSYVVDFGPEGQWNCTHAELTSVANPFEPDEDDGWDEDEELEQDITEEEAARIYADESARPSPGLDFRVEERGAVPVPPAYVDLADKYKSDNKKIDFEADLARMVAEAERKSKGSPF